MNAKDEMNKSLYNASTHLVEAAKYLSDVDVAVAQKVIALADQILAIIDAPTQKLSDEKMASILDDIMKSDS
jgi:hypothetical protein